MDNKPIGDHNEFIVNYSELDILDYPELILQRLGGISAVAKLLSANQLSNLNDKEVTDLSLLIVQQAEEIREFFDLFKASPDLKEVSHG